MTLALAILFLWIGAALLYVAFTNAGESVMEHPGDAIGNIAKHLGDSAYK